MIVSRAGRVVSGRRLASRLFGGCRQLADYFGAEPQPGTLNIILNWPIQFRPDRCVVQFEEMHRRFWPVVIEGQQGLIQRWPNCPLHVVELMSPYRFPAREGDRIRIEVNAADTEPISYARCVGWAGLWLAFRGGAYASDGYFRWATKLAERFPGCFGQQPI